MVKDYIHQVLQGDKESYRFIIRKYGSIIRAYLASHLNDPSTVDDLAQDVFISAFEKLSEFDMNRNFNAWLKGIARNKLYMHLRETYREINKCQDMRLRIYHDVANDMISASECKGTRIKKLQDCLEKLPGKTRDIVKCRYSKGEKVRSIANRYDTTVSAISSLLYRGKNMLESCIDQGAKL